MSLVNTTAAEIRRTILVALHQIAPEVNLENLNTNVALREELELDSMDFLRFILLLEKAFIISIPEKDYLHLASLESCIEYLNSKISH